MIILLCICIGVSPIFATSFPNDFLFGVATSAYQIEGGYKDDGKGENIYDHYTNKYPEKFHNSNGNIAADSYHKYQEDVELLADLGVKFYRFSISWSRILPNGFANEINEAGIKYYNNLIDALLEKDIEPMVTMYHWDLPLPLQKLGGWTNPYMANYFQEYAAVLFRAFGDRVKWWLTINSHSVGYEDGKFPPFLNHSGITNYLCTYVQIQAHARAYHLYDSFFRRTQNGKVGIVIDAGTWFRPASDSREDIAAAARARKLSIGLTLNPILYVNGDFPEEAKEIVKNLSLSEGFVNSRLPSFSSYEIEYIQGTYDFLGINLYTTFLVKNKERDMSERPSTLKDMGVSIYQDEHWEGSNSDWVKVTPEGARELLKWVKVNYDDPEIIITENGYPDNGEINDLKRIQYLQKYLQSISEAIYTDNVNVKGYALWSLLDNFEWAAGYRERYGIYHVDFNDPNRTRTPKTSAKWYQKVIKERKLIDIEEVTSRLKGDL